MASLATDNAAVTGAAVPALTSTSTSTSVASFASSSSSSSSSSGSASTGKRASSAVLRLMSDLKYLQNESPEGISACPVSEDNLYTWTATITGPDETAFEGGIFSLKLMFSDQYPDKPPKIRFTSEIFHPNVYADGTICLDIIQDQWSPIYSVASILTSIQSLLTDPNPASPANPEAAKLFQTDIKAYKRKVRRCAQKTLEE